MIAIDVMTRDVITAAPDTTIADLIRMMLEHSISAVPIVESRKLLGIVSDGDLLRRSEIGTEPHPSRWLELLTPASRLAADYAKLHGLTAANVMTHDVVSVTEVTPLSEVAQLLATRRVKRVPVTRDGTLVGIISRRNLLEALASRLAATPASGDDRTIREKLLATLQAQAWIDDASAISVVVADGAVHLWGVVANEDQRHAIIVAAETIPGVAKVVDHMDHPRFIDPLDRPNWPIPAPP